MLPTNWPRATMAPRAMRRRLMEAPPMRDARAGATSARPPSRRCRRAPLRPEVMSGYLAVLARRAAVKEGILSMEDDEPYGRPEPREPFARAGGGAGRSGAIAVIPIRGTIVQRADQLGLCEGGTSTEQIS